LLAVWFLESKALSETAHPVGEEKLERISPENSSKAAGPMPVDTGGGRYHVQWDDSAPMTPLGQMVFFAQFLHAPLDDRRLKTTPQSRLLAGAPLHP
jgi:hypothetical protein